MGRIPYWGCKSNLCGADLEGGGASNLTGADRGRMWIGAVSPASLQTAHLWANTGVVFRELSFSRLECGVHDRLHILPPVWDLLLPLA